MRQTRFSPKSPFHCSSFMLHRQQKGSVLRCVILPRTERHLHPSWIHFWLIADSRSSSARRTVKEKRSSISLICAPVDCQCGTPSPDRCRCRCRWLESPCPDHGISTVLDAYRRLLSQKSSRQQDHQSRKRNPRFYLFIPLLLWWEPYR